MNASSTLQKLHLYMLPSQLNKTPSLFTLEDLDAAKEWLFLKRKNYSPNSDIWDLSRHWSLIKSRMLDQLNNGSYLFNSLDRYDKEDGHIISLWSSYDMIALKLLAQRLGTCMASSLSSSCYHVKGHGGLKRLTILMTLS